MADNTKTSIKCASIEIIVDKDRKQSIRDLSRSCQHMLNRMFQVWINHHIVNDTAAKLRQHFSIDRAWREKPKAERGERAPWPADCQCISKELSNLVYRTITAEFPSVNARTRVLLQNKWQSGLRTRKSAEASLKGWVAILFGFEGLPSYTRPQPIPFDACNCDLSIDAEGTQMLSVLIERDRESTKTAKPSFRDVFPMLTKKSKAAWARKIIDCIMHPHLPDWVLKGSSICVRDSKFFALISYTIPHDNAVQSPIKGKLLRLIPAETSPWRVEIVQGAKIESAFSICGTGQHVTYARAAIYRRQRSRKQYYRWAGSARKGHGRKKATDNWLEAYSWRQFQKKCNEKLANKVLSLCKDLGIVEAELLIPKEEMREQCFLHSGDITWDWLACSAIVANKLTCAGVTYIAVDWKPKKEIQKAAV